MIARYGRDTVALQNGGALVRAKGKAAVWDVGGGARSKKAKRGADEWRRGDEVLIETVKVPTSFDVINGVVLCKMHVGGGVDKWISIGSVLMVSGFDAIVSVFLFSNLHLILILSYYNF